MRRNSFVQMALTGRIGVRLTGGGAAGSSLDADAATLIAAMTTAPDATRQGLINDLIIGLKTDGVWAELDELWVMAAHAEQAALLGWKRAKDLTAVNAPTFTTDRGFAGNGTTSYLNTNFVPSTDGVQYTLNDASLGVYSRTASAGNGTMIGASSNSSAPESFAQVSYGSGAFTSRVNQGPTAALTFATATTSGLAVSRRTASNALQMLRNGASSATSATVSTYILDLPLWIGALNYRSGFLDGATVQIAAAFVGASMSEAQQLALFNRLETYLDAIGAGVVS